MNKVQPMSNVAYSKLRETGAMKSIVCYFFLVFSFSACIPQVNTINRVIILNAPAELAVASAAPMLQDFMTSRHSTMQYQFISKTQASFAEGHADLFGSRAIVSSSAIANRMGAEVVLMVSAPLFEREIKTRGTGVDERREISTQVQLELNLLDPLSQEILAAYKGPIYTTFRVELTTTPVVELAKDFDMLASLEASIQDLSPQLAADLDYLFRQLSPVSPTSVSLP